MYMCVCVCVRMYIQKSLFLSPFLRFSEPREMVSHSLSSVHVPLVTAPFVCATTRYPPPSLHRSFFPSVRSFIRSYILFYS